MTPFGPDDNGAVLTAHEFDGGEFEEGWHYQLLDGRLVVSEPPPDCDADANDELGYWLRRYHQEQAEGIALDATLSYRLIRCQANRRLAARVIWAGLGRLPRRQETPTIVAEFVSEGKRDRERDYETKRDEYMELGVTEYWIIDRFEQIMTVWTRQGHRNRKRVVRANQVYRTDLLPGFELPLARLLAVANRWPGEAE